MLFSAGTLKRRAILPGGRRMVILVNAHTGSRLPGGIRRKIKIVLCSGGILNQKIAGTSIGQCLILEECCKRLVQTPLQIHSFLLNGLIQLGKGRLQRRDGFFVFAISFDVQDADFGFAGFALGKLAGQLFFFLFFWNVPKFFLYGLYFLRGNGSILPGLLDNLSLIHI